MDSFYVSWNDTCVHIVEHNETNWKQDATVHGMLEHVPGEYANKYLDLILERGITIDAIQRYTSMVDAIGNPGKDNYVRGYSTLQSSTTCLRYLYHAIEIVELLADCPVSPHVVEIGGGYGGLVVAIDFILTLQNIKEKIDYTILDLPGPNKLQKYYTDNFSLTSVTLHFVNGESYGAELMFPSMFVISNYCLAEMGDQHRQRYIQTIFSKPFIVGGYMQWNSDAPTNFLDEFSSKIEEENPKTGPYNKTIIFRNTR
jgi:hypothetical protein